MIRIVLADDHPVVTDGLVRFFALAPDIAVVATASSREALDEAIAEHAPDVVVVDLNMPGMQGATSVAQLAADVRGQRVVVFSMQEEDLYAVKLLRAGAKAYLSKSRPPDELAHAVRLAARGSPYLTDALSSLLLTDRAAGGRAHEGPSAREREVFDAIAGGTIPKKIAKQLGISVSTVHTYTERIKVKLGVETVPEIVSYAFRNELIR